MLFSCSKDSSVVNMEEKYFPPINTTDWATISPEELNWNETKLQELYSYLEDNGTRAFMIIKDGKIASEKYWGKNIDNTVDFDQATNWYWASAAKTLTASLVGIAQEQGHLDINNKTSDYLGTGWTSMPVEKENLITIKNQLCMTTGLDYSVAELDCTDIECLEYGFDAGEQWYYHNAPYTLLDQVMMNATSENYNDYTSKNLTSKIGMSGLWIKLGYLNLFWSTARDAARFGLLMLNEGQWDNQKIISDGSYFKNMINSSQEINPSYGYLWWLNGKSEIIFPGVASSINTSLAPNAPADMYCALGKNGQFIDIVPSMNLVVIRMGTAPDGSLVPIVFHDEMWKKLMEVF